MTTGKSAPTCLTRLRPLWAVLLCLAVCSILTGPAHASKANPAGLRSAEAMTPGYKPPLPPPAHDFTELLWSYTTDGSVESTPAVADGVVYVGSADRHLYALDAASGKLLWRYLTDNAAPFSPTVVDGVVYFGSENNRMRALDASSGELLWTYKSEGRVVQAAPAVVDDAVYFNTRGGSLHALDTTNGELLWRSVQRTSHVYAPAVAKGIAYIGALDSHLYALDAANGKQLWRFAISGRVHDDPVVSEGVLYFSANSYGQDSDRHNSRLYALDAVTGEQLWSSARYRLDAGPVVGAGAVYVLSGYEMYALDAGSGDLHPHFRTDFIIDYRSPAPWPYSMALYMGSVMPWDSMHWTRAAATSTGATPPKE